MGTVNCMPKSCKEFVGDKANELISQVGNIKDKMDQVVSSIKEFNFNNKSLEEQWNDLMKEMKAEDVNEPIESIYEEENKETRQEDEEYEEMFCRGQPEEDSVGKIGGKHDEDEDDLERGAEEDDDEEEEGKEKKGEDDEEDVKDRGDEDDEDEEGKKKEDEKIDFETVEEKMTPNQKKVLNELRSMEAKKREEFFKKSLIRAYKFEQKHQDLLKTPSYLNDKKEMRHVVWVDKNNKDYCGNFLEATAYEKLLPKFEFIYVNSIEDGFEKLKKFPFGFAYIITSGSIASEFYQQYELHLSKLNVITANIIYCAQKSVHSSKVYAGDKWYNPGGVNSKFSEIVSYLRKDETNWEETYNKSKGNSFKRENSIDNKPSFYIRKTHTQWQYAIPTLLGKFSSPELCSEEKINAFKDFIKETNDMSLIKLVMPAMEKEVNIPLQILSKFYLKLFSNENFQRLINDELKAGRYEDEIAEIKDEAATKAMEEAELKAKNEGKDLNTDEVKKEIEKAGKDAANKIRNNPREDCKNLSKYSAFILALFYGLGLHVIEFNYSRELYAMSIISKEKLNELQKFLEEKENLKKEEDEKKKKNMEKICGKDFGRFDDEEEEQTIEKSKKKKKKPVDEDYDERAESLEEISSEEDNFEEEDKGRFESDEEEDNGRFESDEEEEPMKEEIKAEENNNPEANKPNIDLDKPAPTKDKIRTIGFNTFFSFFKTQNKAFKYMERPKNFEERIKGNSKETLVKLVIERPNETEIENRFFPGNIDTKDGRVVFLPFTSLNIDRIEEENGLPVIYLKYLLKEQKDINDLIDAKSKNKLRTCLISVKKEVPSFGYLIDTGKVTSDTSNKIVLWVDQFVNCKQYKEMIEEDNKKNKDRLKPFMFERATTVKQAYHILNKYEYIKIYVILSSRWAESFINKYEEKIKDKGIVTANIIFKEKNEELKFEIKNPDFVDPGKVVDNFTSVVDYLCLDQCKYDHIQEFAGILHKEDRTKKIGWFGPTFMKINNPKEIISQSDQVKVKKESDPEEIKKFKEYVLEYVNGYLEDTSEENKKDKEKFKKYFWPYLVQPNEEKIIKLPAWLYSKFYMKLYGTETAFYGDMNKYLSNHISDLNKKGNGLGDYKIFFDVLNLGVKSKLLKPYTAAEPLFRGSNISTEEYNKLTTKGEDNSHLVQSYYSTNFLSFSKDLEEAKKFYNRSRDSAKGNSNLTTVLFIMEAPKGEMFFNNIEMRHYSGHASEKEVLYMPFSCFECYYSDSTLVKGKKEGETYSLNKIFLRYKGIHKSYSS